MNRSCSFTVAFLAFAAACTSGALAAGPDVTLQSIGGSTNYGLVGSVRGYFYDSNTCNVGSTNLLWTNSGTPAYATNLYRMFDGRIQQIGMSFCKMACCAAAGSGCGTCNGQGGSVLGSGCKDVYSSGWNGGQSRLAARSAVNGYTGAVSAYNTASGDAAFKRLQVAQSDIVTSVAGFPGARFIAEGVYTATDEIDGDASQLNNATYRPVNIDQTAFNMTFAGTSVTGTPAIYAWRDHGLGLGVPDPSVSIQTVDVPGEGRFVVGHKVTTLPSGRYRYDYAIFNLNSHRSMGGLGIPVYDGVSVTNIGFSDVNYHSGEVYDNTNWTSARSGGSVSWSSPQTFAQNANSNALRWGTMYNYWFEADSAPVMRSATMNLFRPGTPSSLSINVRVPACRSDFNVDGQLDFFDYLDFVEVYSANGAGADFNRSGGIDFFDYLDFVDAFSTGCN